MVQGPEAKVGAVIVDSLGSVIALGYNGFPKGIEDDDRLIDKQTKLDMIVHAEANALLIAGHRARGGTIYVVGKPVCSRCAGLIIQSGITRIVCQCPDVTDESSAWTRVGVLALDMFNEADVPFDLVEETEPGMFSPL
jgi:dCMP deaminase